MSEPARSNVATGPRSATITSALREPGDMPVRVRLSEGLGRTGLAEKGLCLLQEFFQLDVG